MSLPRALIIKQHFSFSCAAVFGGYWREMNILKALELGWTRMLMQVSLFVLFIYLMKTTKIPSVIKLHFT